MNKELKSLSTRIPIIQSINEHELNRHFSNKLHEKYSVSSALRKIHIQNYTEILSHPHQNVCHQDTENNRC